MLWRTCVGCEHGGLQKRTFKLDIYSHMPVEILHTLVKYASQSHRHMLLETVFSRVCKIRESEL
jgi:hypothetical protein